MPQSYDPLTPPDPAEWLAIDEGERLDLVQSFVDENEPGIPGKGPHVSVHVLIENQIALGDETPVKAAHERLMREGLNRHDAIHAIGSAFLEMMWENDGIPPADAGDEYFARVKAMTAEKWLAQAEDEDGDSIPDATGELESSKETNEARPLTEVEVLHSVEGHIADEDLRAREELGLTITDSNVKSALRKAMALLKGRQPIAGPKKPKPKDRWIADLAAGIHEIGKVAAANGLSRQEFRHALLKIEDSLKTRTGMRGGSRGYLDFIHRFLNDGNLL